MDLSRGLSKHAQANIPSPISLGSSAEVPHLFIKEGFVMKQNEVAGCIVMLHSVCQEAILSHSGVEACLLHVMITSTQCLPAKLPS